LAQTGHQIGKRGLKPSPFYQIAIEQFKEFQKGSLKPLENDQIVLKKAYAYFRNIMVEKPKVLYSNLSDRYKIWEKLRKLNISSEAKDLVWLLSHRVINTLYIIYTCI
jgi:hypothetical protein